MTVNRSMVTIEESVDQLTALVSNLLDDFDATIRVSGDADRETEVYPQLDEVFELDLSDLDEQARERLLVTVQRAIDTVCTVGRTLKAGAKMTLRFDVEVGIDPVRITRSGIAI